MVAGLLTLAGFIWGLAWIAGTRRRIKALEQWEAIHKREIEGLRADVASLHGLLYDKDPPSRA